MAEQYFEKWDDERFYDDQGIYHLALELTPGLVRGNVLDLGCGSRIYYDTSQVEDWCGVDLSHLLLDQITFLSDKKPSGEVSTVNSSCLELDLPDNSFDTVCSIFLLHHLAKDNRATSRKRVKSVFANAYRMLKPGGKFLIFESWPHFALHLYNLGFPVIYPFARRFMKVEVPYFFSAKTLSQIGLEAGFQGQHILAAPIYETARYPVGGMTMPGWIQPLIHKYGIYVFTR